MKRRVIVVDPHVSVREMLACVVAQRANFDVVAEADSGLNGLELCNKLIPDIIIFELALPELCGIELLRRLRSQGSRVRTLVYAGGATYAQMIMGLRNKPNGFVMKRDSLMTLCEAARVVANGGVYFSASVAYDAAAHLETDAAITLSNREREVLQMVAESTSSKEIATRLTLSVRTVENHRMRIMEKLGLHDTAALTRFAVQQGLVA